MRKILLPLFVSVVSVTGLFAQNTLFDNTRVSAVYIDIPADSLNWIMANVLSDHYCKATFIYDYGVKRDTLRDVGFRLRGNTSRYSKKKSFKISFNTYVSGRRYQEVKKINLNGQHNDPTLIREKLFYDCWKKAGLPERRTSFVQLFINKEYYGLYTNLEEFDKDWLQRVYGENEGNLYKCTYPAELGFRGSDQQLYKDVASGSSTGGRAYDLQTNETADDYSDLVALITALNQPVDANFANQVSTLINVDGLLKAFALDVATGNWDDYMYNMNNYFLYHNSVTGKFEFLSYDADNTFGVDWVNRDWATRNCLDWYSHSGPRPLVSKILAVPEFNRKYQLYLDTIVRNVTNPVTIFPHIESLKAQIDDAVATDTYRTLDYGYSLADFNNGFIKQVDGHTPYGIKPFLTTRYTHPLYSNCHLPEFRKLMVKRFHVLYPNPVAEKTYFLKNTGFFGNRERTDL
ncbi:MAG: CotH kinase family protein [Bacteroidales bacterium]